MLRGVASHLAFISLIIIGISLVAGAVVHFANEIHSYWDAVWWDFLRLKDPGYLGEDRGVVLRTTGLIVTILGYVLFLGALVAILTSWMNRRMEQLRLGRSPVIEKSHFLILGWSKHAPALVREFALSSERVRLRIGRRRPTIVPEMSTAYLEQIEGSLRGLRGRVNVVFRVGNPLVSDDLRRVAVAKANTVVLLAAGNTREKRTLADTRTIKALLSVANAGDSGSHQFTGVAELTYERNSDLVAGAAQRSRIEILPTDGFISRIMVQSIRRPGTADIFSEWFAHGKGQQVFAAPVPHSWRDSIPFSDAYFRLSTGLPIGVKKAKYTLVPIQMSYYSRATSLWCGPRACVRRHGYGQTLGYPPLKPIGLPFHWA